MGSLAYPREPASRFGAPASIREPSSRPGDVPRSSRRPGRDAESPAASSRAVVGVAVLMALVAAAVSLLSVRKVLVLEPASVFR